MAQSKMVFVKTGPYNISSPVQKDLRLLGPIVH